MTKRNDDVVWTTVDTSGFLGELAKLYGKYRAQAAIAKEAREAFEEAFSEQVKLPKGKRVAFGYKFGKLSVAVVDAEKSKADKGAMDLNTWVEQQAASERRA